MSSRADNLTAESAPGSAKGNHYRPLGPLPSAWRSLAHAYVAPSGSTGPIPALCDGTGASLTYGQTGARDGAGPVPGAETGR